MHQVIQHLEEESKAKDAKILELKESILQSEKVIEAKQIETAKLQSKLHESISWHFKASEDQIKMMAKETHIRILEAQIKMAEEAKSLGLDNPSWDIKSWEARLSIIKKDRNALGCSRFAKNP